MIVYPRLAKIYHILLELKKKRYLQGLNKRGLHIGNNVDIIGDFFFDPSHCYLISIGDNCTICPNVRLIAHDASTKRLLGYTKIGRIEIRENCFIGDSVIVLPNVVIGPNSIVGAGSVVTRAVPPGVVVAGNPARVMKGIEDYRMKIVALAKGKRIFGKEYQSDLLDKRKVEELLESTQNSYSFLV